MPIFARLSAMSDIAEHMVELKDPEKSPLSDTLRGVHCYPSNKNTPHRAERAEQEHFSPASTQTHTSYF